MSPVDELLRDAEAMLVRGSLSEALEQFTKANREELRAGNALKSSLGIARVRIARGELADATRILDSLVRQFPSEAEPLTYRGVAEERAGKLDSAIEFYRRATVANAGSAVSHFNLGRAYALKKRWPDAVREFELAAKLEPNHPGYLYVLGTAYQLSGRSADAVEALSGSIARDPAFVDAYVTLADVLVSLGRLEVADQLLAEASKRFSDAGVVHSKRAAIAVRRSDLQSAIHHLEQQTKAEPKDEQAWLNLSAFRLMAMDVERAENAIRRALEVNPRSARAHYQLGLIFDACRLTADAGKEFRAAIDCDPSYWRPYNNLGTMLLEDRAAASTAEAVRLLERAVEKAPQADRPVPSYNLALAYWKVGRKAEAAQAAREAAKGPVGNDAVENARRFMRNFQ